MQRLASVRRAGRYLVWSLSSLVATEVALAIAVGRLGDNSDQASAFIRVLAVAVGLAVASGADLRRTVLAQQLFESDDLALKEAIDRVELVVSSNWVGPQSPLGRAKEANQLWATPATVQRVLPVPGGAGRPDHSGALVVASAQDCLDLYRKLDGNFLIVGNPGSGKSVFLWRLAGALLDSGSICLVIEASSWIAFDRPASAEPRPSIVEFLAFTLRNAPFSLPEAVSERLALKSVLLLDGFDELRIGNPSAADRLLEAISVHDGSIVMSTRPDEFLESVRGPGQRPGQLSMAVALERVSEEVALDRARWAGTSGRLPEQMAERPGLRQLCRSSLWLALALELYGIDSSADILHGVPKDASAAEVEIALSKSWVNRKTSKLSRGDRRTLGFAASNMRRLGLQTLRGEHFGLLWLPPNLRVCAILSYALLGGLVGLLLGAPAAAHGLYVDEALILGESGFYMSVTIYSNQIFVAGTVLMGSLGGVIAALGADRRELLQAHSFGGWPGVRDVFSDWSHVIAIASLGVCGALFVKALGGSIGEALSLCFVLAGAVLLVEWTSGSFVPVERPQAYSGPMEALRVDLRTRVLKSGLRIGIIAALYMGIMFGFLARYASDSTSAASAVLLGLFSALAAMLVGGFLAAAWTVTTSRLLLSFVIRLLLSSWALGGARTFSALDRARRAGLLYETAGGYRFRHRALADWIADQWELEAEAPSAAWWASRRHSGP